MRQLEEHTPENHTHTYRGCKVTIEQDDCVESPRVDYDNLGTLSSYHTRYNLGDKNPPPHRELYDMLATGEYIYKPVYLYDHSGLSMNTTGFACPWDSSHIGWIWVSRLDVHKEYNCNIITKETEDLVLSVLESEVEVYNAFLNGEVYYYSIEFPDGTETSLGGIYGYEFTEECIFDEIDQWWEDNEL